MTKRIWRNLLLLGILDALAIMAIGRFAPRDRFFFWYGGKGILIGAATLLVVGKAAIPTWLKVVGYSFVCIFLAH